MKISRELYIIFIDDLSSYFMCMMKGAKLELRVVFFPSTIVQCSLVRDSTKLEIVRIGFCPREFCPGFLDYTGVSVLHPTLTFRKSPESFL